MREDEHTIAGNPLGPPGCVTGAKAALAPDGSITSWDYEVWSETHGRRPGAAGDLLAGQHLARALTPSPAKPGQQPEGAGDRNAIPLYTVPNLRVVHHFLPDSPLRTSALRSLGAYMNVFAIESFMDELAGTAGEDPVAFRLKHLGDPRAQEVASSWRRRWVRLGPVRPGRRPRPRLRLRALQEPGRLRGDRLRGGTAARHRRTARAARGGWRNTVDSGEVVSPDGVRNQMEGGIRAVPAAGRWARNWLFDRTRILSCARLGYGYPILRFPRVPQSVEVHIVPRPGQPFLGTGEAAQGPMAAALANALADAGGTRLRQIPLTG